MVYVYISLGLLAVSGLGSAFYYFLSTQYTDESGLYTTQQIYDGRHYAKLFRDGIECAALKWPASKKPPGAELVSPNVYERLDKGCKRYPLHKHPYAPSKMYPGTKWCGRGHTANNYTELGERRELDKCCRAHDHCPLVIHSRIKKFGLHNSQFYTSSHCKCDDALHDCLKQSHSSSADMVGKIYFNFVRVRCFTEYVKHGENGEENYLVKFRGTRAF